MHTARYERNEAGNGPDVWRGLINGLLIAVPLWVVLGIMPALVLQHWHMDEAASAALMIAAVCEAILVRPHARKFWAGIRRLAYAELQSSPSNQSRRAVAPGSLLRQSLALSALAGAYLQYYFLDVYLQIASLPSLTLFPPATSMT